MNLTLLVLKILQFQYFINIFNRTSSDEPMKHIEFYELMYQLSTPVYTSKIITDSLCF